MEDSGRSPAFDVFPLGGGPYSDSQVSPLYFTPNARGVALFIVGDPVNPAGKFFIHLIAVDVTSGKSLSGKGLQLDLNTDQLQMIAFYPLDMVSAPYMTNVQTTLTVYWKVGVDAPTTDEYRMTIGAQLLA